MRLSRPVLALLVVLGVVLIGTLGQHLYRWHAHAEERAQLERMRERVVSAGVEVLRTQARADTLRRVIDGEDRALAEKRRLLERYNRYLENGGLPAHLYSLYVAELEVYNARVRERNERAREWEEGVARNREAARRYHQLADSIRDLAARIGDPYYRIPLPVEAAAERGVIPALP